MTKQTEVQLVVRAPSPELTQREGKRVHVRGAFTHGVTGHHHTEAMLEVTSLE